MKKLFLIPLLLIALGGATGTASAGHASNYKVAQRAVCHYFGSYCSQAMEVVKCETGGTYSPWAANGQYLGIFQMGSHERATYGHGNNVWAQARAAWNYFSVTGKDWSPWQCKPW